MNANRLVSMILRMVMREVRKRQPKRELTPDEKRARQANKRARQGMKVARRIGRM